MKSSARCCQTRLAAVVDAHSQQGGLHKQAGHHIGVQVGGGAAILEKGKQKTHLRGITTALHCTHFTFHLYSRRAPHAQDTVMSTVLS
eukprot:1154895-Pelagomonas_calceolata.AAC.1